MGGGIDYQGGGTHRSVRRSIIWLAVAAAVAFGNISNSFAVAPTPAFTWDATGTSDYNIPTNWNPDLAAAPANTDNQFLTINNGATAAINGDSQGAFLILGLSTGQSGNLVINSGTSTFGEIRIGGRETVPDDYNSATPTFVANNGGTGTVTQNPGTTVNVTYMGSPEPPVASFYVGDSSGLAGNTANGTYTITGTAAQPSLLLSGIAANDAIVVGTGAGTVATFNQGTIALPDSTTVTSTGFVTVGRRGANGAYTMRGGVLNAQGASGSLGLFVGDGDTTGIQTTTGTFTQNAGTFFLTNGGSIGRRGGTGVYNMVGGILNQSTGTIVIGDGVGTATKAGTNGTLTQTGGDINAANVTVAQIGGAGTYTMSAGTLGLTGQLMVGAVGSTTAGLLDANGTLNLSGTGAITIGTNLNVAIGNSTVQTAGVGLMNMSGGSMQFNASNAIFAIGNGLISSSTVNVSGGTINILGGTSQMQIGRSNAPGTLNISGTATVNAHQIVIDSSDVSAVAPNRTVNISGGTVATDLITFGSNSSKSTRALNITGGNVHAKVLTTGNPNIGAGGSAVTTISNNAAPVIDSLEIFSNSTFKVLSNLSLVSTVTGATQPNYRFGSSTLEVGPSATLTINGPGDFGTGTANTLTKTGTGTLTVNAPQTYFTGSATKINAGTINYNSSVTGTSLAVTVASGSTLGGTGTVGGAVTNNGTIAPGVAGGTNIGTLTTNAGVTDGANSNWAIELNGASSDQLIVNGNVDLSAVDALNISGSPGSSTSWIIGTYTGGFSGVFDNITSGYSVTASGGNITLNLAALPGDFNGDGKVNASDYASIRKQFPNITSGAGLTAYTTWRANFGNGSPGAGSGLGGNQAVPEPSTLLLAVSGVLLACTAQRRRE